MLTWSSLVSVTSRSDEPTPASCMISWSSASPCSTTVRRSWSAMAMARSRLPSMILRRTDEPRSSSARATNRPILPPPAITMRWAEDSS